jgi:hypothetical protein
MFVATQAPSQPWRHSGSSDASKLLERRAAEPAPLSFSNKRQIAFGELLFTWPPRTPRPLPIVIDKDTEGSEVAIVSPHESTEPSSKTSISRRDSGVAAQSECGQECSSPSDFQDGSDGGVRISSPHYPGFSSEFQA